MSQKTKLIRTMQSGSTITEIEQLPNGKYRVTTSNFQVSAQHLTSGIESWGRTLDIAAKQTEALQRLVHWKDAEKEGW